MPNSAITSTGCLTSLSKKCSICMRQVGQSVEGIYPLSGEIKYNAGPNGKTAKPAKMGVNWYPMCCGKANRPHNVSGMFRIYDTSRLPAVDTGFDRQQVCSERVSVYLTNDYFIKLADYFASVFCFFRIPTSAIRIICFFLFLQSGNICPGLSLPAQNTGCRICMSPVSDHQPSSG